MNKLFLILPLAALLFATQGWAPPPGKGGATGGQDVSKCDLKPDLQTKIKLKDKSGKIHHICTGVAICGGKTTPVSCKVSEREACPMAKKCIEFPGYNLEDDEPLVYTVPDSKSAVKFWTTERIEKAKPLPMPNVDDIKSSSSKSEIEIIEIQETPLSHPRDIPNSNLSGLSARESTKVIEILSGRKKYFMSSGKIFIKKIIGQPDHRRTDPEDPADQGLYFCSGSLIEYLNSSGIKKSGVITNSHCVYRRERDYPEKRWAERIVYTSNVGLGRFFMSHVTHIYFSKIWHTTPGYGFNHKLIDADFAILELERYLPEVGAFGLLIGADLSGSPGYALGYPTLLINQRGSRVEADGKHMYVMPFSKVSKTARGRGRGSAKTIKSNMFKGTSGGPWVGKSSSRFGYIFGLNAFSKTDNPKDSISPWFDNKLKQIFDCFAEKRTCTDVRTLPLRK